MKDKEKSKQLAIQNKRWLVYYYTNNFKSRKYAFISSQDLDKAWIKAEETFGVGNIESVIEYDIIN